MFKGSFNWNEAHTQQIHAPLVLSVKKVIISDSLIQGKLVQTCSQNSQIIGNKISLTSKITSISNEEELAQIKISIHSV